MTDVIGDTVSGSIAVYKGDVLDQGVDNNIQIASMANGFEVRYGCRTSPTLSGRQLKVTRTLLYRAVKVVIAGNANFPGGIVQLTRSMAEAWSGDGVVTNAISPGFFRTELTEAVFDNPDRIKHHAEMTAIGRNGELTDLDSATVYLASRAAAYITGTALPVDGGYSAK